MLKINYFTSQKYIIISLLFFLKISCSPEASSSSELGKSENAVDNYEDNSTVTEEKETRKMTVTIMLL